MKKILLIIGVVIIVVGVIALLYAAFNRFIFYSLLDGSNSMYSRLRIRMTTSFIIGVACEVVGVICLIIKSRL